MRFSRRGVDRPSRHGCERELKDRAAWYARDAHGK
jgi:hypothetical protein